MVRDGEFTCVGYEAARSGRLLGFFWGGGWPAKTALAVPGTSGGSSQRHPASHIKCSVTMLAIPPAISVVACPIATVWGDENLVFHAF